MRGGFWRGALSIGEGEGSEGDGKRGKGGGKIRELTGSAPWAFSSVMLRGKCWARSGITGEGWVTAMWRGVSRFWLRLIPLWDSWLVDVIRYSCMVFEILVW